jgi:hypothetical protein
MGSEPETSPKTRKSSLSSAAARSKIPGRLCRVHAKPVHVELLEEIAVDVEHPGHDRWVLRHEVVESEEVAQQDVLPGEVGVATVVVVDRVVEPLGMLGDGIRRSGERRGVGKRHRWVECGKRTGAHILGEIELHPGGVAVGGELQAPVGENVPSA